jgi:hypothetical protein
VQIHRQLLHVGAQPRGFDGRRRAGQRLHERLRHQAPQHERPERRQREQRNEHRLPTHAGIVEALGLLRPALVAPGRGASQSARYSPSQ